MLHEAFLQPWSKFQQAWKKHPRLYKTLLIIFFILYAAFAILIPGRPYPPLGDGWVQYAPTAAQVFKDFQSRNKIDSPARQAAAFEILKDAIQNWTGVLDVRHMSPRAAAKLREYAAALGKQPYGLKFNDGACSGKNCIRWQYYQKQWGYSLDLGFAGEVLGRYFPFKYRQAQLQASKTPRKAVRSPFVAIILGTFAIFRATGTAIADSFTGVLWVAFGTIVLYGTYWLYKTFFKEKVPTGPEPPLTENFGTARFAPVAVTPGHPSATALGVFLGKSSDPAYKDLEANLPSAPMVSAPEHHTLIVARTRTGKGTRVIVPTLLRYTGNAFVIDPKGENAAITARTRRDTLKQNVHIINPWNVLVPHFVSRGFSPATYNPLDILDRNDSNAVATARRLASAICPVTGRGDDLFWQQSAATILAAVFLWLADQPGETKTLARAREIVTLSRKAFTEQFLTKMVVSNAFGGAIREMIGNLFDLADQTYSGITANLTLTTDFISDPQLKNATNTSTFSMADLRDKPATLFLVIPPDEIDTQKTWLRLLIAATTHSFRRPVRNARGRRCMMLMDEFPALGRLQDLPTDIATMAGYGLDYTLIVQGINQLKSVYDKDAGVILNNCAYQWYCNVTDLEGAKHLSDSLGEATVRTTGKSQSTGTSGSGGTTAGENTTWGEKGRRLLTPDEIINLGRDVAIAFQPNGMPMYLKPIDYWNLPRAFAHLAPVSTFRSLYWEPPLTWDDNPYFSQTRGDGGRSQTGQRETGQDDRGNSQSQGSQKPPPGGAGSSSARGGEAHNSRQPPPGGAGQDSSRSSKAGTGPKAPPGSDGSGSTRNQTHGRQKPPPGGDGARSQSQSGQRPPPGGDSDGQSQGGSGQGSAHENYSQSHRPPPPPPPMDDKEARAVLGVGSNATKDEIRAAYKRLMVKVHPDHEGSTYLAQKINEAKVVLLGK